MPLRVAMVGNGATVHALIRGGAMAALGHTVRLVTLGPVLSHQGIEVRTRPIPQTLFGSLVAFWTFQRDLRSFQPDLLHVHYAGGRLGSLALASGLRPLVVTVMGGDVQPEQLMGRATPSDHRATKRMLAEADLILSKSTALKADIARYGDYEAKIETVRWGIETEHFARDFRRGDEWRSRLGLGRGPVLLSPRILRPHYNVHLIVDAMPAVLTTQPEAVLLISRHREDADYARMLRGRVSSLGLERSIKFIEPLSYEDMPAILSMTDVVVSVPFSDGLPQTLFESLASETPIVMGRLPSYEELVTDEAEVLLADLTPESIAAQVSRVLNDRNLAVLLARRGLDKVRSRISLIEDARRVEGFYYRVLEQPRRKAPLMPRVMDAISLGRKRA
ncbi:MAG: glycosyltransferase family 4 protein [Vicinamibacteria bacterium]